MQGIESSYQLQLQPHPRNPRARVRVLSGTDDGQDFQVQVPLRLKTVEAALEWLRPAGVPEDALRQGEFYFVPSPGHGPHDVAGCYHADYTHVSRYDCGSQEETDGGSSYQWRVRWEASFSATHSADHCLAVVKSGDVAFVGRRRMRTHGFVGRPRYFVRGGVEHDEHGRLELPRHTSGAWYEVIPNRVHGPFPVEGYGQGD